MSDFSDNTLINVFKMLTERLCYVQDLIEEQNSIKTSIEWENATIKKYELLSIYQTLDDIAFDTIRNDWKLPLTNDTTNDMKIILKFIEPYIFKILSQTPISYDTHPSERVIYISVEWSFSTCHDFKHSNQDIRQLDPSPVKKSDLPNNFLDILFYNEPFTCSVLKYFTRKNVHSYQIICRNEVFEGDYLEDSLAPADFNLYLQDPTHYTILKVKLS